MELKEQIRKFIESNLVVFEDEAEFSDSDNIFEMGFVNSLFAMKLVNYIEENFSIQVANDDLEISNFNSVNRITEFIGNKRSAAA
ncbi:MAG: acyl carrier protein [Candidatus Aminicenantes bacterium]|jgi:methoxymalonate biosynthesis acyl carrier protein|nr:acyl carrier protein [Candidatus Aminicenantes bacterium]